MDAFTQPGIHKVVAKTASQVGKSDIMNNVLGRYAHLDPGPMMMIQPTIELSEDYSKSRISPMIRDTKVLTELFSDIKTRDTWPYSIAWMVSTWQMFQPVVLDIQEGVYGEIYT